MGKTNKILEYTEVVIDNEYTVIGVHSLYSCITDWPVFKIMTDQAIKSKCPANQFIDGIGDYLQGEHASCRIICYKNDTGDNHLLLDGLFMYGKVTVLWRSEFDSTKRLADYIHDIKMDLEESKANGNNLFYFFAPIELPYVGPT
jgi:hypothetical protein